MGLRCRQRDRQNEPFRAALFLPRRLAEHEERPDLSMKVTRNGDLLLFKDDEVAVVRRGLPTPEFVEGGGGSLAPSTSVLALVRRARTS